MGTTQPIKNLDDLNALKNYYLVRKPNLRNYALICTGINTALRIGDILNLKWKDVYNFDVQNFRKHIIVKEKKTGKENIIAANANLIQGFKKYMESLKNVCPSDFIFYGKYNNQPLSRYQAFRIIKDACNDLNLPQNISCHSLRKTFGYHAWRAGTSPVMLMVVYNHSSFQVTKRYLCIEQDEKDKLFYNLNL